MSHSPQQHVEELGAKARDGRSILIVVGAHLKAEIVDRPLAYRLRDQLKGGSGPQEWMQGWRPIVCTDVWYLNDASLQGSPAIAIGDPSVNAATAHLCTRLPTAMVIENTFRIHLDPEFIEPQACLWGVDVGATEAALAAFAERFLSEFLQQAWDSV